MMTEQPRSTPRAQHPAARGTALLTPRHTAVLTAIAIGLPQNAAAHRYGISPRTLRRITEDAARRLGAANTTHAVALAAATGLIDPEHLRDRTTPPLDRAQIIQQRGPKEVP